MPPLIPVSVLSGFLGAGKTTFLNQVLRGDHGKKIAVLVNEIGAIGVDGALLDTDESFVTLDNGCICCSLNEDLPITLAEMSKIGDIDHVVIETTGVADPLPVGFAVDMPETKDLFSLDALISIVDCSAFLDVVDVHEEVRAQVAHCDLVILSKCDLVDAARIEEVNNRVAALNGKVRILRSDEADCVSLALDLRVEERHVEQKSRVISSAHAKGFDALSFDIGGRSTIRFAFEEFLEYLPKEVIRAKGIVPLDGERGRLIFHRVGERLDISFESDRSDDGRIVLIGKNLDRDALMNELEELFEVA